MHERHGLTTHRALALSALALLLCACTPPESSGSSPAESDSSAPPRDIGALDVCARVPVGDVARALGMEETGASADLTQREYATDCTYTFTRDGFSKYAIVFVYRPELWAPEARDDIEEVSGLGDAAYSTTMGSFAEMHVLVKGELYIDARADGQEGARRLAELALSRLTGGKTSP